MIFMYSGSSGRFTPLGGSVVRESSIGTDDYTLSYPNVSSCTTITVVLRDGSLIGVHLDKFATTFNVYAILQKMVELTAGRPVETMAVVGALRSSFNAGGFMAKKDFAFPNLFGTLAEAFDFSGGILWTYDQPLGDWHYRVRSIGGSNILVTSMNVGTKMMQGMQVSKNFDESERDPWESVRLIPMYIPPPFH